MIVINYVCDDSMVLFFNYKDTQILLNHIPRHENDARRGADMQRQVCRCLWDVGCGVRGDVVFVGMGCWVGICVVGGGVSPEGIVFCVAVG